MDTKKLLESALVKVGTEAANKDDVLQDIAAMAAASPVISGTGASAIFTALRDREKISSTGFGHGIAIPHCALDGIDDFVVGILTAPAGVEFDTMDGKPVNVFVLIIAPKTRRTEHIKVLSAVSRVLNNADTIKGITAAATPAEVRQLFTAALAPAHTGPVHTEHVRLEVTVQDRNRFDDVLQLLSEQDDCSVSVLETRDARDYLSTMPLFASFWSTPQKGFQRLIIAVLPKGYANDIIRRINLLHEHDQKEGILITLTELTYAGGSLTL